MHRVQLSTAQCPAKGRLAVLIHVLLFQVLITAIVSIGIPAASSAEPDLEEARSKAHIDKMLMIAQEIRLEKSQEKIFWKLYQAYQEDIRKLGDKRIKLIEDAKRMHATLTDAQATELIRRALGLEEHRLAAKRRNVALFLEKLPPKVVARYFQLENKIQTEVDAAIADRMPLMGGASLTPEHGAAIRIDETSGGSR